MKKLNRILVCICCIALLVISWMMVLSEKSDLQVQQELIAEAKVLMEDKIYVRAEPLLTEIETRKRTLVKEQEKTAETLTSLRTLTARYSDLLDRMRRGEELHHPQHRKDRLLRRLRHLVGRERGGKRLPV